MKTRGAASTPDDVTMNSAKQLALASLGRSPIASAIQSGVILSRNGRLTVADLPSSMTGVIAPTGNMLEDAVARRYSLERVEQQYARMMLESVGGNKTEAAA